jgi:hypothetical protein
LIELLVELRPETKWRLRAGEFVGGPPSLMASTVAKALIRTLRESVEAADQVL